MKSLDLCPTPFHLPAYLYQSIYLLVLVLCSLDWRNKSLPRHHAEMVANLDVEIVNVVCRCLDLDLVGRRAKTVTD